MFKPLKSDSTVSEISTEETERISRKDFRPITKKPTASELNARQINEIYKEDYTKKITDRPNSDQTVSDLNVEEINEIAPQDNKNKVIIKPTSAQIDSDLNTEEIEGIREDDFLNKAMKKPNSDSKVSELSAEEMLLEEEESYKAILDEDAKINSSNEREYMEHDDSEKYELRPETEEDLTKQLNSLMTRGQTKKRSVNYKGINPYIKELNSLPESADFITKSNDSERRMRKKTVLRPSFHPPINPRVRIPRPPSMCAIMSTILLTIVHLQIYCVLPHCPYVEVECQLQLHIIRQSTYQQLAMWSSYRVQL